MIVTGTQTLISQWSLIPAVGPKEVNRYFLKRKLRFTRSRNNLHCVSSFRIFYSLCPFYGCYRVLVTLSKDTDFTSWMYTSCFSWVLIIELSILYVMLESDLGEKMGTAQFFLADALPCSNLVIWLSSSSRMMQYCSMIINPIYICEILSVISEKSLY
jgi:hypothetical protein